MLGEFGIFLTRCVRHAAHAEYWVEAVQCIRRVYLNVPIVIIDDGSDLSLFRTPPGHMFQVYILQSDSDCAGAGELLPYYYLHKLRLFHKALILHDSMFLQAPLDVELENTQDVAFLWNFKGFVDYPDEYRELLEGLSPDAQREIPTLYKGGWTGCFGTTGIITLEFVDRLANECGLLGPSVMKQIWTRPKRCSLERVFALCCKWLRDGVEPIAICGDVAQIPSAFKYHYAHYYRDKYCLDQGEFNPTQLPVMKVWSSR